jgi:hypothetical protein
LTAAWGVVIISLVTTLIVIINRNAETDMNIQESSGADAVTAQRGDWVQIHRTVVKPEDRSPNLPDDTKRVPLEMWVNGFLLNAEASIGDEVEVETAIRRRVHGQLRAVNPGYSHSFGTTVPELLQAGMKLRAIMRDIGNE